MLGFGCGGRSVSIGSEEGSSDDDSGVSGTTSSGGTDTTEPSGGVGGTSGASGSASGGASTETRGRTNKGGWTGNGGYGGTECRLASDCKLVSDCCGCWADPVVSGSTPAECNVSCELGDTCATDGIGANEVTCVLGQCVIDWSCDRSGVTCPDAPPACPLGTVPSVSADSCWGPCMAPTECGWVTDCEDCGDSLCVGYTPGDTTYACRYPFNYCRTGAYCECLVDCPYACFERDDMVSCVCLECG